MIEGFLLFLRDGPKLLKRRFGQGGTVIYRIVVLCFLIGFVALVSTPVVNLYNSIFRHGSKSPETINCGVIDSKNYGNIQQNCSR